MVYFGEILDLGMETRWPPCLARPEERGHELIDRGLMVKDVVQEVGNQGPSGRLLHPGRIAKAIGRYHPKALRGLVDVISREGRALPSVGIGPAERDPSEDGNGDVLLKTVLHVHVLLSFRYVGRPRRSAPAYDEDDLLEEDDNDDDLRTLTNSGSASGGNRAQH